MLKNIISAFGIKPSRLLEKILLLSLQKAVNEQELQNIVEKLRKIVPDIANQYTTMKVEGFYAETKTRGQQAFQMRLFEKTVRMQNKDHMNIVDIGDSAGTHLTYIKNLCPDKKFRTMSVNINKQAVEKIQKKGMEAIHCVAEDLDLGNEPIDLYVTFQMVEHLMNPCLFFHRLAVKGKSDYLLITVPYRKVSSVGLWTYRPLISALRENHHELNEFIQKLPKERVAEDEHIFELSPLDWKLLMLFSGWKPVYDEIYFQYPKKHFFRLTKPLWRNFDFEGFWGVILKRDLSFSNIYKDWCD
tara:strand:+ start:1885 stop:2787 length:903 start_codon:yes stop_codon:yes gene_type:complete